MVIPSKEFVYHGYLTQSRQPLPEVYDQMFAKEARLQSEVMAWLSSQSIAHVDIAPVISDALQKQGRIYSHDNDGHPLPAGYEAYAKALFKAHFEGNKPR